MSDAKGIIISFSRISTEIMFFDDI